MISIKDLEHFYRNKRKLSLSVPDMSFDMRGVVGILGHNGSGKSTLLSSIAGMIKPKRGSVSYQGKNTWKHYENIKYDIHLVSLDVPLFAKENGHNHIRILSSLCKRWDYELQEELIEQLQIPLDEKSENLSRGEATKLKVLLTLCQKPRVVLIDEVTNDLDVETRRLIFKKLDAYSYQEEAEILVATNIVHDMERFAHHIVLMQEGKVILSEEVDSLKDRFKKVSLLSTENYGGGNIRHLQHDELEWDGRTGKLVTSHYTPELTSSLEDLGLQTRLEDFPLEEIITRLGGKLR